MDAERAETASVGCEPTSKPEPVVSSERATPSHLGQGSCPRKCHLIQSGDVVDSFRPDLELGAKDVAGGVRLVDLGWHWLVVVDL